MDPLDLNYIKPHIRRVPEVFREEGYVFFFYSNEGMEPAHIHVRKASGFAKFWLEPVELAYSEGMKTQELAKAEALLRSHYGLCLEKWHEIFGS